MAKPQNQYEPEVVSIPGETLQDVLDERGMSQADLALRMGRPKKTISEIVTGKAAITADTALQLEAVLGIPASFWLAREQKYRESLARRRAAEEQAANESWLREIPVRELERKGWIRKLKDAAEQVGELLRFFGVASPEQWRAIYEQPQASFRRAATFTSHPGALAAWLRAGEIAAGKIVCQPFNAEKFRAALSQIRAYTREVPTLAFRLARELCASAGVALVVVEEVAGSRVNGVTRWLSSGTKALIQLSGRHRKDDIFWFTFFHEAGHILLHAKREVFLETTEKEKDAFELEADSFAREHLIPAGEFESMCRRHAKWSEDAICSEATRLQIAPGILLGRLQKESILAWSAFASLKQTIDPRELAAS